MTSRLRGADVVARTLVAAGVKRVFALSGNHVMSVFDAALDAKLEIVHVRHEAAAVHMADAWGRLTGEPGVALVTGGPGHANAGGETRRAPKLDACDINEVVREAIVNAVAHRDYNQQAAIQVSVFKDRIEVVNPGETAPLFL